MTERVTRHGEVHYRVVPDGSDRTIEKRGGYEAPKTPYAPPEAPAGPAQGASTGGTGSSTTSTSDD